MRVRVGVASDGREMNTILPDGCSISSERDRLTLDAMAGACALVSPLVMVIGPGGGTSAVDVVARRKTTSQRTSSPLDVHTTETSNPFFSGVCGRRF